MKTSREENAAPRPGDVFTGVLQAMTRGTGAFVVVDAPGVPDLFVEAEDMGTALHGDEVRVQILRFRDGRAPVARVERVMRHANRFVVGRLTRSRKMCVVHPKNPKIRRLIHIHRTFEPDEVPEGAWVVAEIRRWSHFPHEPLVGSLHEVLGTDDDPRLPVLLLVREGGISPDFPEAVEAEAAEIRKRRVSAKEIERRRDFRGERVFTIDPATAKDFDDAISLVERRDDGWRVAVHIADVAHWLRVGSKTDAEAFERATSIYPVDRVIPMLPEVLSNDLCSLRPGEDKLTVTAIFDVDRRGAVSNVELRESAIHSVRRFTYEEAQGLFDEADGLAEPRFPRPDVPAALREDLLELRSASRALLAARMKRGSLDLDLPETSILFDADGGVASVGRKERIESHRTIEDLMIAANEAVARTLRDAKIPLLYRDHEPPNPDKLEKLAPAFSRFGIHFRADEIADQAALQRALEKAAAHPAGLIVQRLVLRSMMRADYRPENVGHFGLASECYCHFTSPIRRYPDVVVHRAVKAFLGSRDAEPDPEAAAAAMGDVGRHCSSREERSQRIEWDAEKILVLDYMRRYLGDVFDGWVGGVTRKGFFVELAEIPAEGFVPLRAVEDDWYDLDESGLALYGRSGGRVIAIGDKVTVQIVKIDVLAGEMDLKLVRRDGKARADGNDRDGGKRGGGEKRGKGGVPYDWRKHAKKGRRK